MPVAVQSGIVISVRPFGPHSNGPADLRPNEVHIWLAESCKASEDLTDLRSVLSPEEAERASRFHFDPDRAQYIQTRGTLRRLLGSYLGIPAGEVAFDYSGHGKPSLGDTRHRLEFNVSHTRGMAVLGFCRAGRIGVDVEHIHTDFQTSEVAERFFSLAERTALRALPAEYRHQAFFRIWTRKEAYIKALGEGLSHPLHQFDVSLDDTARLIATRPDPSEAQRWRLENIAVPAGFAAAVAIETVGGMQVEN